MRASLRRVLGMALLAWVTTTSPAFALVYPPKGSGPEYVQYAGPIQLHDHVLLGGLLAYAGLIFGGILALSRRRAAGLWVGGVCLVVGAALMLTPLS